MSFLRNYNRFIPELKFSRIRQFWRSRFTSSNDMDPNNSEEDNLLDSHEKLTDFINKNSNVDEAIKEYVKNCKYESAGDFEPGLEWFNVSESLSFTKHLKGKIVLLDFFTYCCINCMHIIPDLRKLEEEFSIEDGLVVIGVHSAKFENEKVSSNILSAVQRYNIAHPVVNDYKYKMWTNCKVNCWPTLVLLGPNANPLIMLMGEGHLEDLRVYIKNILSYYKSKKEISNHSLPIDSAFHLLPDLKGPLLFPGKITSITCDRNEDILAVSDSGNNRILIIKPNGSILHEIGSKRIGLKDGDFENCEFNAPQGLVFRNKDTLFVADTENHAIRKIDLKNKTVETVVGTGEQGKDEKGGKLWKLQEISSPWDLCIYQTSDMDMTFYPNGNPPLRDVLIIAMAGTHQIWALFLEDTVWWKCSKYPAGTCLCIAGSGKEENRNNSYPQAAAFAQPSGLALNKKNKEVYIADSESSSVRRLSLVDGKVTAVVGGDKNPQNLFSFGDKDGPQSEAKLQHLLGLAMSKDEETLFVADTYNHKIKKVDISKNILTTLSYKSDITDKLSNFNEPAGLCIDSKGQNLYIVDTNNHVIKVIELTDNDQIHKIRKLDLNLSNGLDKIENLKLQTIEVSPVDINYKGGKLILEIGVNFKNNLKLTEDSPNLWFIDLPKATWSCIPTSGNNLKNIDVVISIPAAIDGKNKIDVVFKLITCTSDTCIPKNFVLRVPVNSKTDGLTDVTRKFDLVLDTNDIAVQGSSTLNKKSCV